MTDFPSIVSRPVSTLFSRRPSRRRECHPVAAAIESLEVRQLLSTDPLTTPFAGADADQLDLFAESLSTQVDSTEHANLLSVLEPHLAVKPSTVMVTKVTIVERDAVVVTIPPAGPIQLSPTDSKWLEELLKQLRQMNGNPSSDSGGESNDSSNTVGSGEIGPQTGASNDDVVHLDVILDLSNSPFDASTPFSNDLWEMDSTGGELEYETVAVPYTIASANGDGTFSLFTAYRFESRPVIGGQSLTSNDASTVDSALTGGSCSADGHDSSSTGGTATFGDGNTSSDGGINWGDDVLTEAELDQAYQSWKTWIEGDGGGQDHFTYTWDFMYGREITEREWKDEVSRQWHEYRDWSDARLERDRQFAENGKKNSPESDHWVYDQYFEEMKEIHDYYNSQPWIWPMGRSDGANCIGY